MVRWGEDDQQYEHVTVSDADRAVAYRIVSGWGPEFVAMLGLDT